MLTARIRSFLVQNNILLLSAVLLSFAAFFFHGAEKIRDVTNSSNPDAFDSGDIVTVKEALDGDNLLIEKEGILTDLRLLGIDSFSPTVSDPLLSEYGQICFQYLQSRMVGETGRLEVPEKRTGDKGRLLGTLFVKDDAGDYTLDVALDLIKKGYSLVYTRYDFDKMDEYLKAEAEARRQKQGCWGNPSIAARADSMKKLWEEEKAND